MKAMTMTPAIAKGELVSKDNRRIRAFILAQGGRVSQYKLQQRFTSEWLVSRLRKMQDAGHIRRIKDEHGNVVWEIGARQQPTNDSNPDGTVALPRRVDMFGPVYKPAPVTLRSGALDHTSVPSLQLGSRTPYRGGQ